VTEYLIVIEQGETSYGAYSPDLPGCVAVGETLEGVERLMREAIALHIEGLLAEGEPLPRPRSAATGRQRGFPAIPKGRPETSPADLRVRGPWP
jgi:predicted RNase H-like HicB family nuclease